MFTGIVEKTVRVIATTGGPGFRRLTLADPWGDLRPGESVAVNGCCLTVADLSPGEVGFDVIEETLGKTNIGLLQSGGEAHVERSLRVGDRLDGHFVQGHIDGSAPLVSMKADDKEWRLTIQAPPHLVKYLSPKGSVCVDGVSLTVAAIRGDQFDVAIIPTTLRITMLGRRQVGWPFNLEADILSKTIVFWLERRGEVGKI